ncbi:ComEC/Rec2 family competence protein [Microbacterium sp. KUDC0406]|uniref:ComEC/Rec2 family competence protein n=1 Tax=Microbacterium sp. KUDC0406 TaxID=2909588 RepID=UPI001F45AF18|nr:ComEC/Rec2 family competence protein [Microbacterium sp. KUDC0406]UJP10879.1 ComEC/Rec2 family competence protein [Microbacterium sp. KUDC0406]
MKDLRSALLAASVWAIALIAVLLPGAPVLLVAGAVLAAAVWLFGPGRRRRGSGLVVLSLLCGAAVALSVASALPARDRAAELGGRAVEVTAEVSSSASVGSDGRLWLDARTVRLGPPGHGDQLAVPVRIGIDPQEGVDLGAELTVTGQAKATDAGERAALVVFATAGKVSRPASGVFGVAAQTRAEFITRAIRLPEPGAGLLPGLAVGDTRAVSEELNAAMLASGLSHLTAVSGANCAIVVAAVFWIVALCGGGRRTRVLVSLAALGAFVVLVTPEPSVVRAAVMAALAMLSVLLGRPSAGMAMLSVAITGILLTDPWLATSPGFALSAAATAALLLLARPLSTGLARWMPEQVALALAVPLAAQLVCGPIVALFSEQQSIVGVVANLIAEPAAPIATVIGLLACLTAAVPPLADLLAATAWLPSSWIATTATVTSDLPGAVLPVVAGAPTAAVIAGISAAIAVVLARVGPPRVRTLAGLVLAVALALGGARVLLGGPLATLTAPEDWSIAACDVGQGDALLVRSEGRVALIDTGPDPDALSGCLRQLGIAHIDLLVLTHFDQDHVGGLEAVRGRTDAVLHGPPSDAKDERLLRDAASAGARLVPSSAGGHGDLGAAQWQVLWPPPDSAAFASGNDASVVVEFAGGGVPRSLFLGDLSAVPQRILAASGRARGAYAVVKVAHHGSRDQDPGLYAQLQPRIALISVGEGNDYGHPRDETLAFLSALNAHILRTDQDGRILLGMRDGGIAVWTEHDAEPAPSDAAPGQLSLGRPIADAAYGAGDGVRHAG